MATLWEVFHDLFHPSGHGALTTLFGRAYFRVFRPSRKWLAAAGPLTLVTVMATWTLTLIVGFALIYGPSFPDSFRSGTGTTPSAAGVSTVFYYSFETLVTLGYGDIVPHTFAMQLASTLEALVGFGIVTASVSSIVLIYPALTRSRTLALGVHHLVDAEEKLALTPRDTDSDVVLSGLASQVTQARIDLIHFPIIYFFTPNNDDASIAKWTGVLSRYASEGMSDACPACVRYSAGTLDASLDSFAEVLADKFVRGNEVPREEVFARYAAYQEVERAV
jgi:hypothetical protein